MLKITDRHNTIISNISITFISIRTEQLDIDLLGIQHEVPIEIF